MAFTAASLAAGQLPSAVAAIYTVPVSTKAIVKSLILFNQNATDQTINVYITRSGGTRRQIYRFTGVQQYATIDVLTDGETWALSAGDTIDADTTTASAVDYTITGATE